MSLKKTTHERNKQKLYFSITGTAGWNDVGKLF